MYIHQPETLPYLNHAYKRPYVGILQAATKIDTAAEPDLCTGFGEEVRLSEKEQGMGYRQL